MSFDVVRASSVSGGRGLNIRTVGRMRVKGTRRPVRGEQSGVGMSARVALAALICVRLVEQGAKGVSHGWILIFVHGAHVVGYRRSGVASTTVLRSFFTRTSSRGASTMPLPGPSGSLCWCAAGADGKRSDAR